MNGRVWEIKTTVTQDKDEPERVRWKTSSSAHSDWNNNNLVKQLESASLMQSVYNVKLLSQFPVFPSNWKWVLQVEMHVILSNKSNTIWIVGVYWDQRRAIQSALLYLDGLHYIFDVFLLCFHIFHDMESGQKIITQTNQEEVVHAIRSILNFKYPTWQVVDLKTCGSLVYLVIKLYTTMSNANMVMLERTAIQTESWWYYLYVTKTV